jgi:hypothetical protein
MRVALSLLLDPDPHSSVVNDDFEIRTDIAFSFD